jgi:hypothetical protein
LVRCSLPFSLVEQDGFKDLVAKLHPRATVRPAEAYAR